MIAVAISSRHLRPDSRRSQSTTTFHYIGSGRH